VTLIPLNTGRGGGVNLSYSEEQLLLQNSAERFFSERYRPSTEDIKLQQQVSVGPMWAAFATLGWLGLPFPFNNDDIAGSCMDIGLLMEQFGKSLVHEPYLGGVILGGSIVAAAGSAAQKAALLPRIAAGQIICTLAHDEAQKDDRTTVGTVATAVDEGWSLTGSKVSALDAPYADHLIVSARTANSAGERPEVMLFLVARNSAGLTITNYPLMGDGAAADVSLQDVKVSKDAVLSEGGDALEMLDHFIAKATVAISWEALGCGESMLEQTIEYMKLRKQFGKSLSEFQAVRHRIADMVVESREARAMILYATSVVDSDPTQHLTAATMVKVKAITALRHVAEDAVQLHGAIGLTSELKLGKHFNRIMLIEELFDTPAAQLERYVRNREHATAAKEQA
jgi:alkylation response protein AidB-like acyl-CoA dehydrogenase